MIKNQKHTEETRLKMSLSAKLRKPNFKGKRHTDETKKKLSQYNGIKNSQYGKDHSGTNNGMFGKKQSEHQKQVSREFTASKIAKFGYLSIDDGQLELIEKWNRLGFNFQPNFQIHTKDFLAYLDGYDKEKNVVLEYDSKYHNVPKQKKKDLVRQNKIVEILKPTKFWRYNSENKTVENVV